MRYNVRHHQPLLSYGASATFGGTPTLYAPLTNSLILTTATGTATPSFTRGNGTQSFTDWENVVRPVLNNEARFTGARRVANMVATKSEDWTNAAWTKTTMTAAATTLTASSANATVLQVNASGAQPVTLRVRMSRISGTGNIQLTVDGSSYTTVTLTGSPRVYSISQTTAGNPNYGIRIVTSGDSINADQIMVENTTAQSNTNPSEYVSVGVLATPYHGANVDAVKYFATKNGNTVASNVVTEATGAALTPANGASSVTTDASGPFGFLVEETRTNIISQSENISHVGGNNQWSTGASTVTTDQTAAPNGAVTADWLKEDGTNSEHQVYWPYPSTTAVVHTASAFLKQKERTWAFLGFTAGAPAGAYFDLANGVIGTISPSYTATMTAAANGFYRCSVTTLATATSWYTKVECAQSNGVNTYTGTSGSGIYVWGVQLEIGSYASSYIFAGGGTRAGDVLTYTFASNASATAGTAYAEVKTHWATSAASVAAITFTTAANGPLYNNTEAATIIRINDGTNNVAKSGLTDMNTAVRKRASSWTGAVLAIAGDGATAATGTFDGNMGSTAIGIGGSGVGGIWGGTIRNVKLYGTAATAAELASMTA